MHTSHERVLTTHTGSPPRPDELRRLMVARETAGLGESDAARLPSLVRGAVAAVVDRQRATGIDVVSEGEASKIGYATYVKERLSGFEGAAGEVHLADLDDYPGLGGRARPRSHRYTVDIIDILSRANAAALAFEGANHRHAHEWTVFETFKLPDDKVIIHGVIDTSSNYVDPPELAAQRILRCADLVGPQRVIAGSDCGFATFASFLPVDPRIAWAKLESLVTGAQFASARLWPRPAVVA